MKMLNLTGWVFLIIINGQAFAFDTVDEQIDHYLDVLANDSDPNKIEMLERLQWSGLTDPRLFDKIAEGPEKEYLRDDLNRSSIGVLSHQIRALGYSGNEKYRNILEEIKKSAVSNKLKKHAKKALVDLNKFKGWNNLIAASNLSVSGKSVEVTTYMKMLNVDDVFVQRLAARATFHEKQQDPDLLALIAEKLKASYLQSGLDGEAQDTTAWYCKALGENGFRDYGDLLSDVVKNTPYKKVKRHASKYTK
jgi:hypothetical protein